LSGDGFGLEMPGMFGTAIAERVSFRTCRTAALGDGTAATTVADESEICEKSFSDGAWDVAGVSCSEGAATVDISDATSSVTCSCTPASMLAVGTTVSSSPSNIGTIVTSSPSSGICRRRLRLRERGGNGEAGCEYQGKSG